MTIWPTRVACWIPKATKNTLRICNTALRPQQWLRESSSVLCYTYVACPVYSHLLYYNTGTVFFSPFITALVGAQHIATYYMRHLLS